MGLCLAVACCSEGASRRTDDFRLCNSNAADGSTIEISYGNLMGLAVDYGTNIRPCNGGPDACIKWPLLIAAPDRMPSSSDDEVRWSVGDYRFRFRQAGSSPATYRLEADEIGPTGIAEEHHSYLYDEEAGFIAFETRGVPHSWTRCAGRLTFDDLRELRERLRPVEPALNSIDARRRGSS